MDVMNNEAIGSRVPFKLNTFISSFDKTIKQQDLVSAFHFTTHNTYTRYVAMLVAAQTSRQQQQRQRQPARWY